MTDGVVIAITPWPWGRLVTVELDDGAVVTGHLAAGLVLRFRRPRVGERVRVKETGFEGRVRVIERIRG